MDEFIFSFFPQILKRVFNCSFLENPNYEKFLSKALKETLNDSLYHNSEANLKTLVKNIFYNENEMPVFLYKLSQAIYKDDQESLVLKEISFLMKDLCSCEFYYSIEIETSFKVNHGIGSIIGSRCKIGRDFIIHQGCTISHKYRGGDGSIIGDNVEIGANRFVIKRKSINVEIPAKIIGTVN